MSKYLLTAKRVITYMLSHTIFSLHAFTNSWICYESKYEWEIKMLTL